MLCLNIAFDFVKFRLIISDVWIFEISNWIVNLYSIWSKTNSTIQFLNTDRQLLIQLNDADLSP